MNSDQPVHKTKSGRPRSDPATVRRITIGVRVSASEYDTMKARAMQMHMSVAQWLREAALTRHLPAPPVAGRRR